MSIKPEPLIIKGSALQEAQEGNQIHLEMANEMQLQNLQSLVNASPPAPVLGLFTGESGLATSGTQLLGISAGFDF